MGGIRALGPPITLQDGNEYRFRIDVWAQNDHQIFDTHKMVDGKFAHNDISMCKIYDNVEVFKVDLGITADDFMEQTKILEMNMIGQLADQDFVKKKAVKLLYRATDDGWGWKDFYKKAQGQENTIGFFKTAKGRFWGTYTKHKWNGKKPDDSSREDDGSGRLLAFDENNNLAKLIHVKQGAPGVTMG